MIKHGLNNLCRISCQTLLARDTEHPARMRRTCARAIGPHLTGIGLKHSGCKEDLRRMAQHRRENPPWTRSSGSSSSHSPASPGGISVFQLAAASPTPSTTSWIRGLRVLSPCQQFSMSSHNGSKIPISPASAGLSGRTPHTMWYKSSRGLMF